MNARNAVAVGFVVFIGAGFIVPVFASESYKGWIWFLQTYQTILGGLLAVAAAYITVHQMQLSDEKSDQRHLDTLKLATLGDRRRVERAVNPFLNRLRVYRDALVGRHSFLSKKSRNVEQIAHNLRRVGVAINLVLQNIQSQTFLEGRKVFDGKLDADCESLLVFASTGKEAQAEGDGLLKLRVDDMEGYFWDKETGVATHLCSELLEFLSRLEKVIIGLEKLAAEYDISTRK